MSESSTIDPVEAERFRRLAHAWWDPAGPFWPLHRLNGLRAAYIQSHLCRYFGRDENAAAPLCGLRLLDIGCGGGLLSEALARAGADVVGLDVVERNIRVAAEHAARNRLAIRYRCAPVETLVGEAEYFDAVLNLEVVEHVADLSVFMASAAELVRPGGLMILATLNRTWMSYITAIVGAEYLLRWLPRGTHQWRRFCRPEELEHLLALGGMQVIERTGVRVNPFRRSFRLTGYMGVNYMLIARKSTASAA